MWRGFFFPYPVTPTVWRMTVSRQKREAAALDCCTCSGLYQTTISGFLSFLFSFYLSLLRPDFSSQLPNNNNNNKIRKWEKKRQPAERERERACPSSQFNYTHTNTNLYSIKMCIAAGWPNGVPPLAGHILYTCVTAIYALYAHTHTHWSFFVFIYFNAHWRDRSCHIFQGITCLMCMGSGCCWKPSEMSSTCPPSSYFYV